MHPPRCAEPQKASEIILHSAPIAPMQIQGQGDSRRHWSLLSHLHLYEEPDFLAAVFYVVWSEPTARGALV